MTLSLEDLYRYCSVSSACYVAVVASRGLYHKPAGHQPNNIGEVIIRSIRDVWRESNDQEFPDFFISSQPSPFTPKVYCSYVTKNNKKVPRKKKWLQREKCSWFFSIRVPHCGQFRVGYFWTKNGATAGEQQQMNLCEVFQTKRLD